MQMLLANCHNTIFLRCPGVFPPLWGQRNFQKNIIAVFIKGDRIFWTFFLFRSIFSQTIWNIAIPEEIGKSRKRIYEFWKFLPQKNQGRTFTSRSKKKITPEDFWKNGHFCTANILHRLFTLWGYLHLFILCDLLYSEPDKDTMGWGENDRDVSFTFGAEVVAKFLHKHDFDLVVRSHQLVEDGYEFFAKRQLVTLWGYEMKEFSYFWIYILREVRHTSYSVISDSTY